MTGTLTIRETSRTPPAARAGAPVALAAVLAALAGPAAQAAPVVLAAAQAVLAGPLDPSARLARLATRSSSPTPCASSPT